jgi:hypothetical protein
MTNQNTTVANEPASSVHWHQQACEMRQAGATYTEIAKKFGRSVPAAYFAVNPHKRHPSKRKPKPQLQDAAVGDNPVA